MSRRAEEAIEARRGVYVKTEALKQKQRNVLRILKSAAESGQPIESSANSEAVRAERSSGTESKTSNSRIVSNSKQPEAV